jgi:hypothetical protein
MVMSYFIPHRFRHPDVRRDDGSGKQATTTRMRYPEGGGRGGHVTVRPTSSSRWVNGAKGPNSFGFVAAPVL